MVILIALLLIVTVSLIDFVIRPSPVFLYLTVFSLTVSQPSLAAFLLLFLSSFLLHLWSDPLLLNASL